jgi:NarL family two-component system response regulator YdfI
VIRAFIVAASPLTRAGLENLLTARRVEVAGSHGAIDALADILSNSVPDVILIDSAGDAFQRLLDSLVSSGIASDFRVVVLVDAISTDTLADAMRAGIAGILPSDISPDQLVAALHAAARGLIVQHPEYASAGFSNPRAVPRVVDELAEPLTRRESEVLQMLASGLGNKEIASRLNISEHTVKFHVASILGKLGASSRTEAVSIGIRRGLVLL